MLIEGIRAKIWVGCAGSAVGSVGRMVNCFFSGGGDLVC